jgi:REP element-mobilizing transposase RayT
MSYTGCSLRKGRFSESKRPYLVTTVTDKRQRIFDNFELARLMIRQLRTNCDELDVDSLAWVVMPDHLHWLFVLNQHSI